VDWLRQLVGLPDTAGGHFVTGGSAANLTALAVARQVKLGGQNELGVVYFSDQTHLSIDRALKLLGFTREQICKLPSDGQFRLPVEELQYKQVGIAQKRIRLIYNGINLQEFSGLPTKGVFRDEKLHLKNEL
jgi:glutamate/tyrosine decarboxylase-like PLP-dependent enzyme